MCATKPFSIIKTTGQQQLMRLARTLASKQHRSRSGVFALLITFCSLLSATAVSAVEGDVGVRYDITQSATGNQFAVVKWPRENVTLDVTSQNNIIVDGIFYPLTEDADNGVAGLLIESVQVVYSAFFHNILSVNL